MDNENDFLIDLMGTIAHRGVLVTRQIGGGYRLLKQEVNTPEEVNELIDKDLKAIEKSIVKEQPY